MDDDKTIKLPPWRGHTNPASRPGGHSLPPGQDPYRTNKIPQGPPPNPSHPSPTQSLGSQQGVQAQQGARPDQGTPPLSSLVSATRTDAPGASAVNRASMMVTMNGAGPQKPPPVKRRPVLRRGVLTICLLLLLLGGGTVVYGYYFFNTNIQAPLSKIIHPVSRSGDEPINVAPDTGSIMGRSWNILLLGSDDDGKYNFPSVLTQVMMVVHVDTVNNSVYMVSIPRDSWVYVPGIGGMHKIDQAFELGANQHGSFDDGVREARLTVEKDYGITIDRYAWVGLN